MTDVNFQQVITSNDNTSNDLGLDWAWGTHKVLRSDQSVVNVILNTYLELTPFLALL